MKDVVKFLNSKQEFVATIQGHSGMNVGYIHIPFNVKETWGKKGLIKVKAWFDGYLYRGSIAIMEKGSSQHLLILTQAVRLAINKKPGDEVAVVLEQDTEERILVLPDNLIQLLEKYPTEKAFFEKLSYTNRKEFVVYITEAKREETKQNHLLKTLSLLQQKRKNPSDK